MPYPRAQASNPREDNVTDVEIVLPAEVPPRILRGELIEQDATSATVRVTPEGDGAPPAAPAVGSRAIVVPDGAERIVGTFRRAEGDRWIVDKRRVVRRDQREYPRMWTGLRLQWKVAEPGEVERWEAGEDIGGTWRQPDPFMDFSAAGLRFRSDPACAAGDTLLLDLALPGHPKPLRAVGRVVRVFEVPPEERDDAPGSHYVALAFQRLRPEVARALAEFTLKLQEAIG